MIRLVLMVSLAVVVAAPVASAQPAPAPNATRREEIKKKIRVLRAYTLTEELGLDEKTAARLFPVLAKWDDVTDKLLVQRVDLARQLRAADQLKDPRAIERLIDDAVANQKAFWDLEDKRLAELRKILSPAQTARLLVVLPEFERKIQNQLRRAIQKPGRQAGRPGGRRNAIDEGDEDDLDQPPAPAELPGPQQPRPGPAKQAIPPAAPCDPYSSRGGCPPKR